MTRPSDPKLDALRKKKEELLERINARIAEAQRLENARKRKEETRQKIVVGSCLLTDLQKNPGLAPQIEAMLRRNASPSDAEFLRSQGWKI